MTCAGVKTRVADRQERNRSMRKSTLEASKKEL